MFINLPEVWHVGSLDVDSRTDRPSLEGPCLSVSVNPEEWGHIARVAGDTWRLSWQDAKWLDACNLTESALRDILEWSHAEGLIEPIQCWRAWHYDGEADAWGYFSFVSAEAARHEIDPEPEETGEVPSLNGELVDCIDGWRATDAGMARLERWADPLDGEAAAIILYAMIKLGPEMPDLAGIWWDEEFNPLSLSCPRGGVIPGRLEMFSIENEYGDAPPLCSRDAGVAP